MGHQCKHGFMGYVYDLVSVVVVGANTFCHYVVPKLVPVGFQVCVLGLNLILIPFYVRCIK